MNSGSQIDLARGNEFKSGSSYSLYSNAASKSYNDLSRQPRQSQHQQAPQKTYASDISNRLPGIVFSGPNGIYNRRVGQYDYKGEIGIGKASGLRSLDSCYLTRGVRSGVLQNSRRHIPNEIGWSVAYFQNLYPRSISTGYPGTKQIPR